MNKQTKKTIEQTQRALRRTMKTVAKHERTLREAREKAAAESRAERKREASELCRRIADALGDPPRRPGGRRWGGQQRLAERLGKYLAVTVYPSRISYLIAMTGDRIASDAEIAALRRIAREEGLE